MLKLSLDWNCAIAVEESEPNSAYSHIWDQRGLFVTANTRDFQKYEKQLGELGLTAVTAEEARRRINTEL